MAFAAEQSFAVPLSVAVASLIEHYAGPVAVFYSEFDPEHRKLVDRAAGARPIQWVYVDPAEVADYPTTYLDQSTWFRFLMPRMLGEVDRILYLDADILVLADVEPLLQADLGGGPLGAVRNMRSPYVSSVDGLRAWQAMSIPAASAHLNAGVLVIDAAAWRRDGTEATLRQLAVDLRSKDLLPMNDQDALNVHFAGRWTELDYRWNQHPMVFDRAGHHHVLLDPEALERLRADPWIVHFVGRSKPWQATCRHPFTDRWRSVARRLDPAFEPERRSTVERITDRVRRATRVLTGGD